MGMTFTLADKIIEKDKIREIGIYSFNFPTEMRIENNVNKVAEVMSISAGKYCFNYFIEKCEILVFNFDSLSDETNIYYIYNSNDLRNTINTAYERLNDGKFTLDGNIAATDFDRQLANFLRKYKDINFIYTEKNLKEIFNEITQ